MMRCDPKRCSYIAHDDNLSTVEWKWIAKWIRWTVLYLPYPLVAFIKLLRFGNNHVLKSIMTEHEINNAWLLWLKTNIFRPEDPWEFSSLSIQIILENKHIWIVYMVKLYVQSAMQYASLHKVNLHLGIGITILVVTMVFYGGFVCMCVLV